MLQKPTLCVIIEKNDGFLPIEIAKAALQGGASMIQLRMKHALAKEVYRMALEIKPLLQGKALLIINDRLDIALAAGADGVHLGQDDLPIDVTKKLAPQGFLVGASASRPEEAQKAKEMGADYLGVGPVFMTKNKPSKAPIGFEGLKRVCQSVTLPVLAIGGITPENAMEALKAGASGVAVISAVSEAPDPSLAIHNLQSSLENL